MTNEHSDFYFRYSAENGLEMFFRDTDRGRLYKGDEVILNVPEAARMLLPPGTPFGEAGTPVWILPQSQNRNLLYLGLAADDLPAGIFSGPVHLRLRAVSGPGHFFAWQAGVQGLDIRMNSSDGITAEDVISLAPQGHAHFNWGFNAPGIYRITFQVESTAASLPVESELATFEFHVLPLQGYAQWQSTLFPCPDDSTAPGADPDQDGLVNLAEYAFGKNPLENDGPHSVLRMEWTNQNGQRHPVLEYRRIKAASDVLITLLTSNGLDGEWSALNAASEVLADGDFEIIRITDSAAAALHQTRFYRLRLELLAAP
jgi:surface-anchored protein